MDEAKQDTPQTQPTQEAADTPKLPEPVKPQVKEAIQLQEPPKPPPQPKAKAPEVSPVKPTPKPAIPKPVPVFSPVTAPTPRVIPPATPVFVPPTAKETRREYIHTPTHSVAQCGGGGVLSLAWAEKIKSNPAAFGALLCSVCGLRPIARRGEDGDEYQFTWKGTEDKVGVQY